MIYLDHNATTPLDAEVKEAIIGAFPYFGNPSSSHDIGIAAKAIIDKARQQVASSIGSGPSEIVFTSGGTESNNLAIIGTAYRYQKGHIITSVIEHPSVLNPVRWLEKNGFHVTYMPVDTGGIVSPETVRAALRKDTILITVMHANNETGVLQPIEEIGRIARTAGVHFHSDAAQSMGKVEVNVAHLMVDMLTIVSHKFYGPKGTGALYVRDGVQLMPVLFGAGHERGLRPGTENTPLIAGLGKACEASALKLADRYAHMLELRDTLYSLLAAGLELKLNGHHELRLPNTLNVSLKGIIAEDIIARLHDKIALSAGSACHAGSRIPSPVLKAMGIPDADALGSFRLSTGKDNTAAEIQIAAELMISCIKGVRA
ncbi:MAG: cysteine desulfurase [Nitrospirae bacterium]|nr:cysteine desulfurase [Nitrospirota bacterium]